MLQALQVERDDRILEVGTGSGFVTALLARLGGHVTSIEIHDSLGSNAQVTLNAQRIENVDLYTGDASHGWERAAPYDVIAVTGSLPVPEDGFQNSLAVGGRLFVVVGREPAMQALLITRHSESQWASECLFETVLPPLVGVEEPERFVL